MLVDLGSMFNFPFVSNRCIVGTRFEKSWDGLKRFQGQVIAKYGEGNFSEKRLKEMCFFDLDADYRVLNIRLSVKEYRYLKT